jgi:hypothetical protein
LGTLTGTWNELILGLPANTGVLAMRRSWGEFFKDLLDWWDRRPIILLPQAQSKKKIGITFTPD